MNEQIRPRDKVIIEIDGESVTTVVQDITKNGDIIWLHDSGIIMMASRKYVRLLLDENEMNEKEIDLEIERLQQMKKELQEVKLPRGFAGELFFYVNKDYSVCADTDDGTDLDSCMHSVGNYYLSKEAAEKKARHARFEAEVKAYLRALNGGEDFWPKKGEEFYVINADIAVGLSSGWRAGYTFKAPKEDHLQKAISKFGEENIIKFFYGEL